MCVCVCARSLSYSLIALYLTPCDTIDFSLPGSSLHGIFQARILEQIAQYLLRELFPSPGIKPESSVALVSARQILYH